MPDFCSSTVVTERQNSSRSSKRLTVTFNPVIKVHLIPDEDRRSEWTTMAVDSALFERRIKLFEEIFVLCN